MKQVGLAVLFTAFFIVGFLALASVIRPTVTFNAIDKIPVKLLIVACVLIASARLGWSIYLHLYVPTARRYVITIGGVLVSGCFISAGYPAASSVFDKALFQFRNGAAPSDAEASSTQEVRAEFERDGYNWSEACTTMFGTLFGIIAGLVSVSHYIDLSKRAGNV